MRRIILTVVVAMSLSSCGLYEKSQQKEQMAEMKKNNDALAADGLAYCTSLMASSEIDIIRSKVDMFHILADKSPVPFSILSNENYPTEIEAVAIGKWADLRDKCNTRAAQADTKVQFPPSVARNSVETLQSFGTRATHQLNLLVLALYQGRITYGQFAAQQTEVRNTLIDTKLEYIKAMKEQDYNKRMQESALAEQQFQNRQQAWGTFLQGVQQIQDARARR